MTDRKPTDAAIVKAFQKFEEGFVVFESLYRNQDSLDIPTIWPGPMVEMRNAHKSYLLQAHAAQERIDARKEGK